MAIDYNHIAGKNLDRIAAISDGIFAVAMTLLVLDLKTPARQAVQINDQAARKCYGRVLPGRAREQGGLSARAPSTLADIRPSPGGRG
jgi:hypothetical protein